VDLNRDFYKSLVYYTDAGIFFYIFCYAASSHSAAGGLADISCCRPDETVNLMTSIQI
jgi:hypothetical protein